MLRFHGDILDGRGEWTGAPKVYADAVGLARDLPAAYYSWGLAPARHGKTQEALAKYDEALKYAPKWKELKKARGALAMQKIRFLREASQTAFAVRPKRTYCS